MILVCIATSIASLLIPSVDLSTNQGAFKPLPARAAGEHPELSRAQLTVSSLRFTLPWLATGCYFQHVRIRRGDFCVGAVPWYTCKKLLLKRFSKFRIGIVRRGAEHMFLPSLFPVANKQKYE